MYSYLVEHFRGERKTNMDGMHVWTVVRNPFSRAVSAWWASVVCPPHCNVWRPLVKTTDFVEFCQWLASGEWADLWSAVFPPQSHRLSGVRLDSAVRIERLAEDFQSLPFVGSYLPPLPALHVGAYGDWRDWYDRAGVAADAVRTWAAADFESFGYSLDLDLAGRAVDQ
jgi:hypothetical protein